MSREFFAEIRRALELIEEFPGAGAAAPYLDDTATRRFPTLRSRATIAVQGTGTSARSGALERPRARYLLAPSTLRYRGVGPIRRARISREARG